VRQNVVLILFSSATVSIPTCALQVQL
jgi:hypothetical protein